MPRKENTKAKTWEKDRRERMNAYFKSLDDLLPPHREGRKRNKVDILIDAAKYIKDLHSRTEELFSARASDAHKEELARMKKLVTQFFSRTQLLSTLLKEAGISIPAEPALERISALKWSNKINTEDGERLGLAFAKNEDMKKAGKTKERVVRNKVPSKRKSATRKESQSVPKKFRNSRVVCNNSDGKIENQENYVNRDNSEKKVSSDVAAARTTTGGPTTTVSCVNCSTASGTDTAKIVSSGPKTRTVKRKLDSHKKVKRKCRTNKKHRIPACVNQPMTNMTSGTLILSSGKIMPVVTPITPLTSNIIVNAQSQSTNPIILSNGQSNQMIVMQHVPNHVQNSVIPVCNQTLINTVQKMTLNTLPSIQTNVVVNSRDWVSNVKSIVNASKIGGRKGILPKGKEITKTTMTYKVPIPAVHKEKLDKTKDGNNQKETDVKAKGKNSPKSTKNQQNNPGNKKSTDELNDTGSKDQNVNSCKPPERLSLKRAARTECTNSDESGIKRQKPRVVSQQSNNNKNTQTNDTKVKSLPSTCKSIESLRHVIEKIGEDITETPVNKTPALEVEKLKYPAASDADDKNATESGTNITDSKKDCLRSTDDDTNKMVTSSNSDQSVEAAESTNSDLRQSHVTHKESAKLSNVATSTSFTNGLNMSADSGLLQSQNGSILLSKVSESQSPGTMVTITASQGGEMNVIEKTSPISTRSKAVCNLGTRFDSLLQANVKGPEAVENMASLENSKVILNLDTNTTTTVKRESNMVLKPPISIPCEDSMVGNKLGMFSKDEGLKSLSYSVDNSFIPINRTEALHSDLSNDIFASLQVPSSSHHPESISPTAAFLMAFPLVSSLNGKTEVLEEEMKDDFKYHSHTPPMLLQIGAMEPNSFKMKTTSTNVAKENILGTNNGATEMEKKIPQKYLKNANEVSKETNVPVNVSATQQENKVDQSLGKDSQPDQHKIDLQQQSDPQVESAKPLPKIVNSETVKEHYKIMQASTLPAMRTSIDTFTYTTSTTSAVSYGTAMMTTMVSSSAQVQPTSGVHNRFMTTKMQNIPIQSNSVVPPLKYSNEVPHSSIPSITGSGPTFQTQTEPYPPISAAIAKFDLCPQYSTGQNFIQNYPNISSSVELPQYTTPTFTTSVQKTVQNPMDVQVANNASLNVSQAAMPSHSGLENPTSSHNLQHGYPAQNKISLPTLPQNVQHGYSIQSKDSLPASSQNLFHNYPAQGKDSLPISSQSHQQSYTVQNKVSPPASSQNLQHNYPIQTKDSLPTSSQNHQRNYPIQSKDSLSTSSQNHQHGYAAPNKDALSNTSQNHQHSYPIQTKDALPTSSQNLLHGYQQNKDSHSYPIQTKDSLPTSSHNHQQNYTIRNKVQTLPTPSQTLQHSYPIQNKESHPASSQNLQHTYSTQNKDSSQDLQHSYSIQNKESRPATSSEQSSKLPDNLRTKPQNPEHRHENYTTKKAEISNFGQTFSYNKDSMNDQQNQATTSNQDVSMFQGKNTTAQSYIPYSKGPKKTVPAMTAVTSAVKPLQQDTPHYSQNQMIVTSNFEQSTVTDNNVKSTTTVAHNSSNFSILSWTTFSPVGGNNNNNNNNNNLIQFEQGQAPAETADSKTICENFNYIPLHKENVGFSNMLPEGFAGEPNANMNKPRSKPVLATQKQPFVDPTKSQNIQSTIPVQKQNPNQTGDYKFANENKSKTKYTMDTNYMQSDYAGMDQQTKHHTVPSKQEKSNYPMPSYDPQVTFNLPETGAQVKYSTENYTGANFKYTDKTQQNQKYQPQVQSHAPVLQHGNPAYKHTQNSNKSKTQQQAIRPPVNWMMTPEIKHNTNIADIILPPIGKELEFCQNNLFSQAPAYNQTATNQFYNNYDVTNSFPHMPVLQNETKKVDTFFSEDQPFSWSPTKNTHILEQSQSLKPLDQHIVPSTLPTLMGDLALGTNIPEKQNFLFGQMLSRTSGEINKDAIKEKEANTGRDYHTILNPQNVQHSAQGTFLSVSQLVEHEKAEKSQQARKQRKPTTSPRGNPKRQMDIRKQTASGEQLHHEEQKTTEQSFTDQNYQPQQKYSQNDIQWRSRNCKSNYTAEALIGTNTSVQDESQQQEKHASIKFSNYAQNKFPSTLPSDAMMPLNYFPNSDDGNSYGQVNQNFNSYSYTSNANIYPTTNFITSISNTPTTYMMPLHDNTDYLESNSFLLPNAASTPANPSKPQQYGGKPQNCDKRPYAAPKRGKRKTDNMTQNIEFPISGINSPLEDYHSTFLPHANLYQNAAQSSIYTKAVNTNLPGIPISGNQNPPPAGLPMNSNVTRAIASNSPMVMAHPSGTSLTNFNLSTIFPEINDKVVGYKPPNSMPPGLSQPTNHGPSYPQRTNYTNTLGHPPQVSEPAQFANNMPPPSNVHYKNT